MRRFATLSALAVLLAMLPLAAARPGVAHAASSSRPDSAPSAPSGQPRTVRLLDGSKVTFSPGGLGWRVDKAGQRSPVAFVDPQGRSGLGDSWAPTDAQVAQEFAMRDRGLYARHQVIVALAGGVSATGAALPHGLGMRAVTSSSAVNSALGVLHAASLRPAFSASGSHALSAVAAAARAHLGSRAIDLSKVYVATVTGAGPKQAAQVLRATPGVAFAEPDFTVSAMNTGGKPLPARLAPAPKRNAAMVASSSLPSNYGLTTSLQSFLNAQGVDASGAYATIGKKFGQLPGQGEIITNVSLGDLTDQSMADNGDTYVQGNGATTIVSNGQRYLDFPSLPMIPTYVAEEAGGLNPLGTVEGVDPYLGEVLLDFSVMAPLPHDQQRPDATGSGASDLLGIAPGASYRLVVPQQPTVGDIFESMLAAAQQTPKPNVITASLGYGMDSYGYAGRYLEDDPIAQTIISGIVQGDGIVVCISANDGTRMYTQAAVGPDGGSVATDLAAGNAAPTSLADDGLSTTPSEVPDTGAIAVGGTTTDDTIAVPPQDGSTGSSNPTWAETRIDGATNFSSGFGTRVNVSAPSDNIPALMHAGYNATDSVVVLDGGTSASAPMTAAAAAVALQVGRLTGQRLTPASVRALLENTGRDVPTPPEIDRPLHVGPQIDVSAAVDDLLAKAKAMPQPEIARFSIAHRQMIGSLGAEFLEDTDPAAIDLAGPYSSAFPDGTGESLDGPITFGVDGPGIADPGLSYALVVGGTTIRSAVPYVRLTPRQLFAGAGQQLISADPRSFSVTFQVLRGHDVVTSATQQLTFGPTDGTHLMAPAPVVPHVVTQRSPVTVKYDLTGVTDIQNPQLIVSSVGHWSSNAAPDFRIAYSVPLTATSGTVTIPASVFAAGGTGIYGVGILQEQAGGGLLVGAYAPLRVEGADAPWAGSRPDAPLLSAPGQFAGHEIAITRARPRFSVSWDVRGVPGATGATVEVSAPGPTVFGLYNTFTNANGSIRDHNGVDTGSAVFKPLPGKSGNITLNALGLGLFTSLDYNVRVFATHNGATIGEASGSSYLEVDDGLAPGGASVSDFSIVPGGQSAVATNTFDGSGFNDLSSQLQAYDPSTGSYGTTIASDSSGQYAYYLLGTDAGLGRTAVVKVAWSNDHADVLLYDSGGKQVSDLPFDYQTQYSLLGGRVDPVRHRLVLLARSATDRTDNLLPIDLATGKLGTPLDIDTGTNRSVFSALDVDSSTGNVVAVQAIPYDLCAIRGAQVTVANLDTGTVKPSFSAGRCVNAVASDQAGGNAYLIYGIRAIGRILPSAGWAPLDESTMSLGAVQQLGANSAMYPVVDPVHHVALVAFNATSDYTVNNNAMSAVGVYDLNTGKMISLMPDFNFVTAGLANPNYFSLDERGIQIDPATRTAWTYGPGDIQIERFSY